MKFWLVCLAFMFTGAGLCADDGPAIPLLQQNGLAFQLIIPKPYQVAWGCLQLHVVLKNVSTRPIRAVTRCAPYAGERADWSSVDLNSRFRQERPSDEDIARSIVTIAPGECLVLPADCPIAQARPYRMVVSYTCEKDDVKRFGCWDGSVGASVVVADPPPFAETKSEQVNVVSFQENAAFESIPAHGQGTDQKIYGLLSANHIVSVGVSNAGWTTFSVAARDEYRARDLLARAIKEHQIDADLTDQRDTITQPNSGGDKVIYRHPAVPLMVGNLQATLFLPGNESPFASLVPLVVKAYGSKMTFTWSPDGRYLLIATDLADGSGTLGLVDTKAQPLVEHDLNLTAVEPQVAAQLPQSQAYYARNCVVDLGQSSWSSSTRCHIVYCYQEGHHAGDVFLGVDTTEATPALKIERVTPQDLGAN